MSRQRRHRYGTSRRSLNPISVSQRKDEKKVNAHVQSSFRRQMIATLAEMESAKVPLNARDFCAHMLLNLRGCIREHFPLNYHCHHEREEYYECQYHDYLDRMKDYEREKRLLTRRHHLRQNNAPNAEEGTIGA